MFNEADPILLNMLMRKNPARAPLNSRVLDVKPVSEKHVKFTFQHQRNVARISKRVLRWEGPVPNEVVGAPVLTFYKPLHNEDQDGLLIGVLLEGDPLKVLWVDGGSLKRQAAAAQLSYVPKAASYGEAARNLPHPLNKWLAHFRGKGGPKWDALFLEDYILYLAAVRKFMEPGNFGSYSKLPHDELLREIPVLRMMSTVEVEYVKALSVTFKAGLTPHGRFCGLIGCEASFCPLTGTHGATEPLKR